MTLKGCWIAALKFTENVLTCHASNFQTSLSKESPLKGHVAIFFTHPVAHLVEFTDIVFQFWLSFCTQKGWNQKEKPLSIKIFDCWVMGFVLKTNCKKKPFIVFHFWEFQKQQQEGIAVSPQYWAKAAASKVVEQQASPKISNFPFWFSQNQKTNSILRKGFEIENSLAVMSPLNGHNKGP